MKSYTLGKLARKVSKELRNNSTDAEKKFWGYLKNRQLLNLKFLRQHPVFYTYNNQRSFFIADFYCHELKMVIELDGQIHSKHKDYDQIRTDILEFKNVMVVRFNNEVIIQNLDNALDQLKVIIATRKRDLAEN